MLHLILHIWLSDTKVKVHNGSNPPRWSMLNERLLGRADINIDFIIPHHKAGELMLLGEIFISTFP